MTAADTHAGAAGGGAAVAAANVHETVTNDSTQPALRAESTCKRAHNTQRYSSKHQHA